MTWNYQFPLADSEKQAFGPPSEVNILRNRCFFSRQFQSGTLLPNPYACPKMMHANSRNLSHRCNFSRSTTLPATPRWSEVGVRVVQGQNRPKPIVFILLDLFARFLLLLLIVSAVRAVRDSSGAQYGKFWGASHWWCIKIPQKLIPLMSVEERGTNEINRMGQRSPTLIHTYVGERGKKLLISVYSYHW